LKKGWVAESKIAIESAGIARVRGSPRGIVGASAMSRATPRNIRRNLFGAFIYNTPGIPLAAGVLYSVTGLLLDPMLAGVVVPHRRQ
jgi:Cu+-exporting ATPase